MGSHLPSSAARIANGPFCCSRAKIATVKIGCLNKQSALAIALSHHLHRRKLEPA